MLPPRASGLIVFWFALLAGCAPEPALLRDSAQREVVDAAAIFRELESTLVSADTVHFQCSITSEGVVSSDLAGSLWLATGNRARIEVAGTFAAEEEVELTLLSDGTRLAGGSGAATFDIETPIGLREAILIGATRMGLLHNLAMLSGGAPPDRADGSMREWVQASGFTTGEVEVIDGAEVRPIRFELTVAGQPSGAAELWVDTDSGLPVRRNQTVHFDGGDMRVVETYSLVELDGNPPPDTFLRAVPDE